MNNLDIALKIDRSVQEGFAKYLFIKKKKGTKKNLNDKITI